MGSRRCELKTLPASAGFHAGLWLDRWVADLDERGLGKQTHLADLIRTVRVPEAYRRWVARWRGMLAGCPPHTVTAEVAVDGRMAVGLGAESVLETALALHHTFGVPYLPGPALKGLAAAAAHRRLEGDDWRKAGGDDAKAGAAHRILFGDLEASGYVTFHDALWLPPAGDALPLDLDVMTVHHADYYQPEPVPPPTDWDDPNPVAFLSARGTYLLAVSGPREWAHAALRILLEALEHEGIGAKTAAGYGRLRVVAGTAPEGARPSGSAIRVPWQARVRGVEPGNAAREVPLLLAEHTGAERQPMAKALVEKLGRRKLREARYKDKDWVKALLEAEKLPS